MYCREMAQFTPQLCDNAVASEKCTEICGEEKTLPGRKNPRNSRKLRENSEKNPRIEKSSKTHPKNKNIKHNGKEKTK